jgi:hypothetical protein
LRRWYVGETGDCERKDARGRRSDIDVLAVVPAQQRDHLTLETPATSFRISSDSLTEGSGNANRSRNRFLGVTDSALFHNQNDTTVVMKGEPGYFVNSTPFATKLTWVTVPSALRWNFAPSPAM